MCSSIELFLEELFGLKCFISFIFVLAKFKYFLLSEVKIILSTNFSFFAKFIECKNKGIFINLETFLFLNLLEPDLAGIIA